MSCRCLAIAVATATSLLIAGCDAADQRNETSQAAGETDVVYVSELTAGVIDEDRRNAPTATLLTIATGMNDGFDRIVFEFDERVPGYHVEYIDRPVRKCGSGDATQLAGDGWLEIRMSPARAHTDEFLPTLPTREYMPDLSVLSELEMTCDFEGIVTWVAGVAVPNRYQVRELDDPPRLIVYIVTRAAR